MTGAPTVTTYPPLEAAAVFRGVGRAVRTPGALGSFRADGSIDEGLLFGGAPTPRTATPGAESASGGTALLLHLGRGAVYLAGRALAGACRCGRTPSVAVPSYHCGSEIEALVRAGLQPRFYRVRRDLSVDAESYREAAAGACIEYVISFFGVPPTVEGIWPPVAEGGRARTRPVIEDAAHALYSRYEDGTPVGTKGDAAIFSLRKSLGVPDGGALRPKEMAAGALGARALRENPRARRRRARSLLSQLLLGLAGGDGILAHPAGRVVSLFSKSERAALAGELEEAVYRFEEGAGGGWELTEESVRSAAGRASLLTYLALAGQWPKATAAARRAHYNRLLWEFDLAEFVPPGLRDLPKGAVPLFLAVESGEREAAVAAFYEAGVRVLEVWPVAHRLTEGSFEKELRPLRDRLIALPVHQALSSSALERVGEVSRAVLTKRRK